MFLSFVDWFYSPNFIEIGDFKIAKYAIMIMMGIVFAIIMGVRECKRVGIKLDDLYDGILYIVPLSIIGARLYYVIFEWSSYKDNLLKIFYIWEGGLAIHGAFLTAIICAIIYCKIRKIDIYKVVDLIAPGFLIGQIFGRWGNFFNVEAYGPVVGKGALTAVEQNAWLKGHLVPNFVVKNMAISTGGEGYLDSIGETILGYYHPTFFYESCWNIIGLIIIFILRRTRLTRSGELLSVYLIWYSIGRFFIESMRQDSLYIKMFGQEFRQAQVISVGLIIVGIIFFVYVRFFKKTKFYHEILTEKK